MKVILVNLPANIDMTRGFDVVAKNGSVVSNHPTHAQAMAVAAQNKTHYVRYWVAK